MAEARRSSGAIAQRLGAVAASVVLIASVAVAVFIGSEAPAEAAVPS
jgi:hypothetical protein